MTNTSQKIKIKPLAYRYLYRIYKEIGKEQLEKVIFLTIEISKIEKHMEIRQNTVFKAVAKLTGKDIKEVKRKLKPLKLTKTELKSFSELINNIIEKYS